MFILQLLVLKFLSIYHLYRVCYGRSQWPSGLRRRFAAARLLRSWVRIPPGAWIFVCCECCVLSGRGLCDELVTRPEESYRMWCVVVCDLESSRTRRPWPALVRSTAVKKKRIVRATFPYFIYSSFEHANNIWYTGNFLQHPVISVS